MIGSVSLHSRLAGLLALSAVALPLLSAPAAAQNTGAAPAGAAAETCAPGALGSEGTYSSTSNTEGDIVGADLAYQCTRTLDDGTYVPEGYRVTLTQACPEGACELPLMFVVPGPRDTYSGTIEVGGEPTLVRMRANPNGALVVTTVSGEGRGQDRQRNRYTLRPAR